MNLGLEGRTAIVLGASEGVGFAVASALAEAGTRIVMVSRRAAVLNSAAEEIRSRSSADVTVYPGDATDETLPAQLFNFTTTKWGPTDIVVNNTGGPPALSFLETTDDNWFQSLQSHLLCGVRMAKLFIPPMGARRWGRLITIGSTVAREPSPEMVLSASARAALVAFMKGISREVASSGVTVNTILLGGVETTRVRSLIDEQATRDDQPPSEVRRSLTARIPMGRFADPREVAALAAFLASAHADYITGQCIAIDGGLSHTVF